MRCDNTHTGIQHMVFFCSKCHFLCSVSHLFHTRMSTTYFANFSVNGNVFWYSNNPLLGVQTATFTNVAPLGLYGKYMYPKHLSNKKKSFTVSPAYFLCQLLTVDYVL